MGRPPRALKRPKARADPSPQPDTPRELTDPRSLGVSVWGDSKGPPFWGLSLRLILFPPGVRPKDLLSNAMRSARQHQGEALAVSIPGCAEEGSLGVPCHPRETACRFFGGLGCEVALMW